MRLLNGKALRRCAILAVMGLLLAVAVLAVSLTVGGSRGETERVAEIMWSYIDEKYPEVSPKNYGKTPQYMGGGVYSLSVSDTDCVDVCFDIIYTNGNIYDDYYYRVSQMTNTLHRLEKEMGEYFGNKMAESGSDILWAEVTLPPRARNDIPSDIFSGVELDPTHPIFRNSTLTLVCRATEDMNAMADLIAAAYSLAAENGMIFSEYSVYGLANGSVYNVEISGVTAEIAENAELGTLLEAALDETVSGSDIEGVSVKLYKDM